MPPADEYTPGEIVRTLKRLEDAIGGLHDQLSNLAFVRQDVWAVERDAMHERIGVVEAVSKAEIEDVRRDLTGTQENLRWLVRAFVGALVTAVVTALVLAALNGGG